MARVLQGGGKRIWMDVVGMNIARGDFDISVGMSLAFAEFVPSSWILFYFIFSNRLINPNYRLYFG